MVWVNNGSVTLDQDSNYPTILGTCIALPILTTIVVALRAYCRGKLLKTLYYDDYVIFFSAVCGIVYAGLCIGQSKWGLGLPIALRPKENLDEYSVINFAGRPFYMFGILGFKVALCIAYLRILRRTTTNKFYKYLIWTVMITCILGHVIGTLVLIFQCQPVQKSWLPLTNGTCLPNNTTFYALAGVTIFFDIVIFFLPIPLLLNLNMELAKKLILCGVFLLGLLTTVCSILRLVQIGAISTTGNSTMLVLWGVIELNVGIILTCIPTLGPLIPAFRNSENNTNRSTKNAYQLSSREAHSHNGMRSAHNRNTFLASNGPASSVAGTPFDKYGGYGPDMMLAANSTEKGGVSDNDDRIALRDAMSGGNNIMKTTHIRVSDEESGLEGVPTKTW